MGRREQAEREQWTRPGERSERGWVGPCRIYVSFGVREAVEEFQHTLADKESQRTGGKSARAGDGHPGILKIGK